MDIIVKSIFGSHLYGTNTVNSDTDYKGIYRPSVEECLLNNISRSFNNNTGNSVSKNTKDDIDEEIYSLQYFMKLAIRGEMIVIDLIHTPKNLVIQSNSIWDKLQYNRGMFYSKNMAGYLGYIRQQTAKYGVKGSRLNAMEKFLNVLKKHNPKLKLNKILDDLPINEYSMFVDHPKDTRFKMYECCGKKFPETISIEYAIETMSNTYNRYGERALMAKRNEGIDWKAISHAFRAGYQLLEIYNTNDLKYPLKNAEYIRDIKQGKLHYIDDKIQDRLEGLLMEVEEKSKNSRLPSKLNKKKLDRFILECYNK